jgi:hypothetical protein
MSTTPATKFFLRHRRQIPCRYKIPSTMLSLYPCHPPPPPDQVLLLKGTVAWDGLSTHSIISTKYIYVGSNIFLCLIENSCRSAYSRYTEKYSWRILLTRLGVSWCESFGYFHCLYCELIHRKSSEKILSWACTVYIVLVVLHGINSKKTFIFMPHLFYGFQTALNSSFLWFLFYYSKSFR